MPRTGESRLHYLILIGTILIGTLLRFWNLDAKPLWMDEVITALFSFGRNYLEIPLEEVFPVVDLDRVFQFVPTTCAGIAETISVQSVHPPLFFCWLHNWVSFIQPLQQSWVWDLRSLPALAGAGAIVVIYVLNRVAFGKTAGLVGALAMAVSPFAVYLSQEARHYTVPMVLIAVALLGLIRIQQDFQAQRFNLRVWCGWILANGIGFYVHYFFVLAVIAQVLTLIALQIRREGLSRNTQNRLRMEGMTEVGELITFNRRSWIAIAIATLGIGLCYLPGLPTFWNHMSRPETDWIATGQAGGLSWIAPVFQLLAGWIVMAIALPVEQQPQWIVIACGIVMLLMAGWLGWTIAKGIRALLAHPKTHWETLTLVGFTLWMLLIFLAIVYVLRKDITQVPRYNFIFFPAVCALAGASLWAEERTRKFNLRNLKFIKPFVFFLISFISCVCVVVNLVFLKPYIPNKVASDILSKSTGTALVVMAYEDFQNIALGTSFALALQQQDADRARFAFVGKQQGYEKLWQTLSKLEGYHQVNALWIIAPGLRKADFPTQLQIAQAMCQSKSDQYYRIGIPYQGYECKMHQGK